MQNRATTALEIARSGGAVARDYFNRLGTLEVIDKGLQDFVTEADRNVETHLRDLLAEAFPDDGIVGEEHAPKTGTSGTRWVIDPIDGTTNFINGIPAWCVVLAAVSEDAVQIGVIHDPVHDETFHAVRGQGAFLNGVPLRCPADTALNRGSISTGYSTRAGSGNILRLIGQLLDRDAVFCRNGSGALSLAYVAAGRFIGYFEEHMNAWDCLAGQLIISEAGGRVEQVSADAMIDKGGRIIAGSAGIFDDLVAIGDAAFID